MTAQTVPAPRVPDDESELRRESIRARGMVMQAWGQQLAVLTGERAEHPEAKGLLHALQYGARPPRHSTNPHPDLLAKLKDTLARQIELILDSAALDENGQRFYRSLSEDLAALQPGDPISGLLRRVCAKARAIYADSWIEAASSMGRLGEHPRKVGVDRDPYTATASTDTSQDHVSEVRVSIYAEHFGVEAFCSLPMLATHEFVAHVPAYPRGCWDTSPFNEGFMDWAAWVFFHDWAPELLPGMARLAQHHGDRLHNQLLEAPNMRPYRGAAHTKANAVIDWWVNLNGNTITVTEAERRLAMLAVRLNVHRIPLERKDHFVAAMTPCNPAMAQALSDFLADPTRSLDPVLAAADIQPADDPTRLEVLHD